MSTPNAIEQVNRRGRGGRPVAQLVTAEADWGAYAEYVLRTTTAIRFPSDRYRQDPVAFCHEILGIEPWAKQIEILHAVRDHKRVAVSSGHKCGKSTTVCALALWYFCSFEDARVVMSSTTARQVDQILWREVKKLRARGGRCLDCKAAIARMVADGVPKMVAEMRIARPCEHSALIEGVTDGELARTGLKTADFREIVGFTAKQAEGVAGVSGANLFYIIDEASGVPPEIYSAIEGNRAAGARIVLISNPTKNEGEFYEAFHAKDLAQNGTAYGYHCITISSEETPNVIEGRDVVPGLAGREWIEEKRVEWGEDSALYQIRVRGKFAINEAGKIFSVHKIEEAEERWHDAPESGRLYIGVDPAGETGSGDESAFCVRRGLKVLGVYVALGLDENAILEYVRGLIAEFKLPRETPVVVIDREGSVGSKLHVLIRSVLDEEHPAFEFVAVRASDKALRNPLVYDRQRDALAANLEEWFRDGGAIPADVKLAKELHVMEWYVATNGRRKLTPKTEIRKAIGRSPDRYDALALACWEPLSLREEEDGATASPSPVPENRTVVRSRRDEDDEGPGRAMDPYSGSDAWGRR